MKDLPRTFLNSFYLKNKVCPICNKRIEIDRLCKDFVMITCLNNKCHLQYILGTTITEYGIFKVDIANILRESKVGSATDKKTCPFKINERFKF